MTIDRATIAAVSSTEELVKAYSGAAMVNLYNFCAASEYLDRNLVKRFSDKKTAVRRTWDIICEFNLKFPLKAKDLRPVGEPIGSGEKATTEETQEAIEQVSAAVSPVQVVREDEPVLRTEVCTLGQEPGVVDMDVSIPEPIQKKLPRPIRKQHSPFEGLLVTPFRSGSKFGDMVDAMMAPGGATMQTLYDICASRGKSWPMPTVRAALLDFIFNRGYNVRSEVRDGEFYAICELPPNARYSEKGK